ncbi:MAG: hemerythrin domain-containing protein [Solirubrobacterales bacterium]|nr:hemerythrin domain-containing protein [Solirubrobacterales bacterium]
MKRDPALASLSRDHHHALFVAQNLRHADTHTAPQAAAALRAYWDEHGRDHFRLEEELLLPAYAGFGDPYHPLVARALCDHIAIRRRVDDLQEESGASPAALRELGGSLAEHLRLEERELFPLIERTLPAAKLAELAAALERVHPPP